MIVVVTTAVIVLGLAMIVLVAGIIQVMIAMMAMVIVDRSTTGMEHQQGTAMEAIVLELTDTDLPIVMQITGNIFSFLTVLYVIGIVFRKLFVEIVEKLSLVKNCLCIR